MHQEFATQRAEDKAAGAPLAKWMTEDPKRRGIPLFLQTQNRRPLTPELRAKLDARQRADAGGGAPGRSNFHKPKGMSWEEFDARQALIDAAAEERKHAAIAKLRERAQAQPKAPRVPGYKGHLYGSRKSKVHECCDQEGAAKAIALGKKLGLKDGTVQSWLKSWGPKP